jgi:hypothetical protein
MVSFDVSLIFFPIITWSFPLARKAAPAIAACSGNKENSLF